MVEMVQTCWATPRPNIQQLYDAKVAGAHYVVRSGAGATYNDLAFSLELHKGLHWSESLLFGQVLKKADSVRSATCTDVVVLPTHTVIGSIANQGRGVEALAAHQNLGATAQCILDVFFALGNSTFVDERTRGTARSIQSL
jgi:hypothetical protein